MSYLSKAFSIPWKEAMGFSQNFHESPINSNPSFISFPTNGKETVMASATLYKGNNIPVCL